MEIPETEARVTGGSPEAEEGPVGLRFSWNRDRGCGTGGSHDRKPSPFDACPSSRRRRVHAVARAAGRAIASGEVPDPRASVSLAGAAEVVVIGGGSGRPSDTAREAGRAIRDPRCERAPATRGGTADSLRLFTAARYDGLIGMPFPAPTLEFPTKDEMADPSAYARHSALPVRSGASGPALASRDRYVVTAWSRRSEAAHVVVAMATYQSPRAGLCAGARPPSCSFTDSLQEPLHPEGSGADRRRGQPEPRSPRRAAGSRGLDVGQGYRTRSFPDRRPSRAVLVPRCSGSLHRILTVKRRSGEKARPSSERRAAHRDAARGTRRGGRASPSPASAKPLPGWTRAGRRERDLCTDPSRFRGSTCRS